MAKKTLKYRGVIEGFYGPMWSHEERLHLIRHMRGWHMNLYIYSPRDDPYHRFCWDEPYSSEEMRLFAELAAEARRQDVQFAYAVSPGNTFDPDCPEHREALLDKLGAFIDLGCTFFPIFYDDLVTKLDPDSDAGVRHAEQQAKANIQKISYQFQQRQKQEVMASAVSKAEQQIEKAILREQQQEFKRLQQEELKAYTKQLTGIQAKEQFVYNIKAKQDFLQDFLKQFEVKQIPSNAEMDIYYADKKQKEIKQIKDFAMDKSQPILQSLVAYNLGKALDKSQQLSSISKQSYSKSRYLFLI